MTRQSLRKRDHGIGWATSRDCSSGQYLHKSDLRDSSFVRTKQRLQVVERQPRSEGTRDVVEVASSVETMSADRVLERYHELADKAPNLSLLERFELERIKARLDADDMDLGQEARNRDRDRRRTELLNSIEDLIDQLRQEQL